MARKAFSTDYEKELPWGRIEPYRLWFEYLKYALTHVEYASIVSREFYEDWGDIENERFERWWETNWQRLFAVPASIEVLEDAENIKAALGEGALVIRLRRAGNLKTQLSDLKKLIERLSGSSKPLKPPYTLSATHSITDKALRAMLRLRQMFDQNNSLEGAAEQYVAEAEKWNEKIKEWNSTKKKRADHRSEMFVPAELKNFAQEIRKLRQAQQAATRKVKQSYEYRQYRVGSHRLLKKFDNVVRNVARGQFPGKY